MTTPEQVFDVNNKMNDEIIFAVRFNKDVEGEGHGYWFSIINLTDDTNQTKSLKECYKDGDKRKNLITYVKVEDKVCVVDALIRAGKRFDMLILPQQRHGFGDMNEYFYWRLVDYFSEHLKGKSEKSVDIPKR